MVNIMDDIRKPLPENRVRFMDHVRFHIRSRQMAYKTEKTYCKWIASYIRFHCYKHPQTLGASDVDAFLSSLAVEKLCAINTQKAALNALVFMYKRVLGCDLGILQFSPSSRPNVVPVVI